MAETREKRRRQPKRPAVYLTLLVLGGALALGAAWQAARPVGAVEAGNARPAELGPR